MSLLPYVVAFLMVLSTLTYSRMAATHTLVPSLIAQLDYAKEGQRFGQNEAWFAKYDDISTRKGTGGQKELIINGCSKLNLKPILNPKQYSPEKHEAYTQLFVHLVTQLHSNEPYFEKAMAEDPNWIRHLLQELRDHKVKHLQDFGNLTLSDPFLDRMLYFLMKDRKSLALYTTFTAKEPLSIFLASPELLLAVYGDSAVVSEIDRIRQSISKQVRKKDTDVEVLKQEFILLKEQYPTPYAPYLSFDISKTRIKKSI